MKAMAFRIPFTLRTPRVPNFRGMFYSFHPLPIRVLVVRQQNPAIAFIVFLVCFTDASSASSSLQTPLFVCLETILSSRDARWGVLKSAS